MSSSFDNSPPSVAAFGKLPWAGDFLQAGRQPVGQVLREWVEQGVAAAADRGERWRTAFDAGAQKAFLLPSGDTVLAGVIAPSRDEVGRRFPFVVTTAIEASQLRGVPQVAPLLLGGFLEGAGVAIEQLSASSAGQFASIVERIAAPDLREIGMHIDGYNGWAQSASLRTAGQAIFGGAWREGLGHALFVCIESIRPFFGREAPPTPLSVRLPVGTGFAGAVAFWIHLVRACSGWSTTIPACFWSFEPNGAAVTIYFGTVSASGFADLWESTPTTETLSNLAAGNYPQVGYLAAARSDVAALLDNEEASVMDLLTLLAKPTA